MIPTRSRECSCVISMAHASILTWEADGNGGENGNWEFVGLGGGCREPTMPPPPPPSMGTATGTKTKTTAGPDCPPPLEAPPYHPPLPPLPSFCPPSSSLPLLFPPHHCCSYPPHHHHPHLYRCRHLCCRCVVIVVVPAFVTKVPTRAPAAIGNELHLEG